MTTMSSTARPMPWRTPAVVIACGCAIAMLSFGPRSAVGQFLTPMSLEYHWGRDIFSFALLIQNFLWGAFQPFAGAVADRYGAVRVLWTGAIAYAAGLAAMAYANTPGLLDLTAGVLIGFALSSCSFNMVIGALGKLVPPEWRSFAFGAGTAAGSFGQFLFSPLALAFAIPNADAPATGAAPRPQQSVMQALSEAFAHRSYVLLVLGFFTCGFQLAFVTVHLPAYLLDRGLTAQDGAWTIALIGLFNIFGSMVSGWLGDRMPKRYILSVIYFARALAVIAFIMLPASTGSALVFGAVTGFLWLSTVPPTSSLVALMFGTRWLAMLFGFAFFSHQV